MTKTNKNKWRDINKELPLPVKEGDQLSKYVLVLYCGSYFKARYCYSAMGWYISLPNDEIKRYNITHWRALPKLPVYGKS